MNGVLRYQVTDVAKFKKSVLADIGVGSMWAHLSFKQDELLNLLDSRGSHAWWFHVENM